MNHIQKFHEALLDATDICLARDPNVYLMGLGVPDPKGIFGTTLGLQQKYGPKRVLDMPVSENGMTGVALGSALVGMRPILTHQRLDFALLAMEQMVNQAAKWHYTFGGKLKAPMVIRLIVAAAGGWGRNILEKPARVVRPCSGDEGGDASDSGGREGAFHRECRRQQSGYFHRPSVAAQHHRRFCEWPLHRAHRTGTNCTAGPGRYHCRRFVHDAGSVAGGGNASRRIQSRRKWLTCAPSAPWTAGTILAVRIADAPFGRRRHWLDVFWHRRGKSSPASSEKDPAMLMAASARLPAGFSDANQPGAGE